MEGELNKLIDQRHIIKLNKLNKCSDKQFISPIVITVKKDQTVKLALDSKKINKFIHKNKYQMPNFDLLLDKTAQVTKSDKTKPTLLSTPHTLKSRWIEKHVNNAISVWPVAMQQGRMNSNRDFTASRICQPNFKKLST